MRFRVVIAVLVIGLAGAGLMSWHGAAPDSPPADAPAATPAPAPAPMRQATRVDVPPSAASAVAIVESTTTTPPARERAVAPTPASATPQPPRATLATLKPDLPAIGDPTRPTQALEAVPPQPLAPTSRVPLHQPDGGR